MQAFKCLMNVHLKRGLVQNIQDIYEDLGLDGSEQSNKLSKMLNLAAVKKYENDEMHYPVFLAACDRTNLHMRLTVSMHFSFIKFSMFFNVFQCFSMFFNYCNIFHLISIVFNFVQFCLNINSYIFNFVCFHHILFQFIIIYFSIFFIFVHF